MAHAIGLATGGSGGRHPGDRVDVDEIAAAYERLDADGVRWGIGGGVGFALATQLPVLRADSDLDLIVRTEDQDEFMRVAEVLARMLDSMSTRVDVQIDTPAGGFAFAEWRRTGGPVLLKTSSGPVLLPDPWQTEAASMSMS